MHATPYLPGWEEDQQREPDDRRFTRQWRDMEEPGRVVVGGYEGASPFEALLPGVPPLIAPSRPPPPLGAAAAEAEALVYTAQPSAEEIAADELGRADNGLEPGTQIAVAGRGRGIYVSFHRKTFGANEHTIQFASGAETVPLREESWTVFASEMDELEGCATADGPRYIVEGAALAHCNGVFRLRPELRDGVSCWTNSEEVMLLRYQLPSGNRWWYLADSRDLASGNADYYRVQASGEAGEAPVCDGWGISGCRAGQMPAPSLRLQAEGRSETPVMEPEPEPQVDSELDPAELWIQQQRAAVRMRPFQTCMQICDGVAPGSAQELPEPLRHQPPDEEEGDAAAPYYMVPRGAELRRSWQPGSEQIGELPPRAVVQVLELVAGSRHFPPAPGEIDLTAMARCEDGWFLCRERGAPAHNYAHTRSLTCGCATGNKAGASHVRPVDKPKEEPPV